MPVVTMPDGTPVTMPDQIDPALGARLRAFHDAAPPADAIGAANHAANASEHGPMQDVIDMLKGVPHGLIPALKGAIGGLTNPYGTALNAAQSVRHAVANPEETLASVKNATPEQVGANVVAPALLGGAVSKGVGLAADASGAAGAAEAASPAGQLGLRSTKAHPVGTTLAGSTAGPTLDAQNRVAATAALGADVGVPHGVGVNPASLEAARVAPGNMLDEGAASLPTAPLSESAAAKVAGARGPATITKPTPNVATQINDIESRMLEPDAQFSGAQIRATRNSLSSDASAGMNSADADTRTIAKYKRSVVDALDQHVADTMPANSAISPEMIAKARETLAKNYSLQDLIGKGGDVDLQQLAADHRANPNKYSGPTRVVAQFASDHPEVTGNATDAQRIAPPSLAGDLSHINILNPRSWIQPLVGSAGRRLLRGPPGASLEAARQTPVVGMGGEFEHRPNPLDLGPPPELTAGPMGAPPAASEPPGQISMADLLSHGLEQGPQPELTAGPMGSPAPQGMPFKVNAEHMAGDLSFADQISPFKGKPMDMSDFAGVKSQGVPDNIMQRSSPSSAPGFEKLGQPLVSHDVAPDQSHVFSSPNGTTTAVRLPDGSLKIVDSTTSKAARGTGEGSARVEAAANFAHESGNPLVSDNEVSAPEQKVYDSLLRRGFDVRENPSTISKGTGVKKSASELKGVYEIHPPLSASFGR